VVIKADERDRFGEVALAVMFLAEEEKDLVTNGLWQLE